MTRTGLLEKPIRIIVSLAMLTTMMVGLGAKNAYADETPPMTISNVTQMKAFVAAVNGGHSYKGETVTLASNINWGGGSFTPIGTKTNPFEGTFDGGNKFIRNFTLNGTSYVGLFGYAGKSASIKDLSIEDATVTVSSATEVVHDVGILAGYMEGDTSDSDARALKNISVEGNVTVSSTLKADSAAASSDSVSDEDKGITIYNIGGVCGHLSGSMESVSFGNGLVSVTTHVEPLADHTVVARYASTIVGEFGGKTIRHARTVKNSDRCVFEPVYPTDSSGDEIISRAISCKNSGRLKTVIDGEGDVDRFGVSTSSVISSVGGIAGYSLGSISSSSNTGEIYTETGSSVGGIVGNMRGVAYTGSSIAISDAGTYSEEGKASRQGPTISVSKCTNDANIVARAHAGGIMGVGGTYTLVTQCSNKSTDVNKLVVGMRWNKPTTGGIAGQTYGTVNYCYNRSRTQSDTGAGFYMAGLVGMLCRFSTDDGDELNSPQSVLSNSYSTGNVLSGGKYKEGGVCGENNGYIHDCYYLEGNVENGLAVAVDTTGTTATSVGSKKVAELQSKDKGVAAVNASTTFDQYSAGRCFVPAPDKDTNDGYPVLAYERQTAGTAIDESKLSFSGTGAAVYTTAENPVPALSVTYNGTKLVQNADYFVAPDASALSGDVCRDISEIGNTVFQAGIIGMGDYSTSGAATAKTGGYKVGKGDFSTCAVDIVSKVFNNEVQPMGTVTVLDPSGVAVSDSSYTAAFTNPSLEVKNYHRTTSGTGDKKSHEGYEVKVTAGASSNYTGVTYGYFVIYKPALLNTDFDFNGFTYNGERWYWFNGDITSGGNTKSQPYKLIDPAKPDTEANRSYGMQIAYTGESIKPKVEAMYYTNGTETAGTRKKLIYGTDYKVVYGDPGDPNDIIETDTSTPNLNVTSDKVGERACVTVRNVQSDSCNYGNYQNVFFDIVAADIAKDCTVSIPSSFTYTGKTPSASSITVKGKTGVRISTANYTVKISSVNTGTRTVTVTGRGNLKGSFSRTVKVVAPKVGKVARVAKCNPGKSKCYVSWSRVSGAYGYQIAYRMKGTSKWKTVSVRQLSRNFTKLKRGKTYQFKVRAYKRVGSKNFYGAYSSIKTSAKIK